MLARTFCLAAGLGLAACGDPSPVEAAKLAHGTALNGYQKPGAQVRISGELREALNPGDAGAMEITVREAYETGRLTLRATTCEGMSILTTNDATSFDMAGTDTHAWTVYFETGEEGRFYVNILADVETGFDASSRAAAFAVTVGKPAPGGPALSKGMELGTDESGEAVIMMQAEETIIVE